MGRLPGGSGSGIGGVDRLACRSADVSSRVAHAEAIVVLRSRGVLRRIIGIPGSADGIQPVALRAGSRIVRTRTSALRQVGGAVDAGTSSGRWEGRISGSVQTLDEVGRWTALGAGLVTSSDHK
jgi:hypothetical protein